MAEHICDICIHEQACAAWVRHCTALYEDFQYSTDNCPCFQLAPVHCKDCQHRGEPGDCPMCCEELVEWDDDGHHEWDYITHDRTTDDGFCDCGERRDTDVH